MADVGGSATFAQGSVDEDVVGQRRASKEQRPLSVVRFRLTAARPFVPRPTTNNVRHHHHHPQGTNHSLFHVGTLYFWLLLLLPP
jgi:hypothetical protein